MTAKRLFAAAAVLLLGVPAATASSPQAAVVMKRWQTMDLCAKRAQAAFPDFTAASNAKRDARLQECLNSQNLPPREPSAPRR